MKRSELVNRPYDELCEIVNKSYEKTQDIRKTMEETVLSFNLVWEMTGMNNRLDFNETEKIE